jgi:deoxyhypusine synthase
MPYHTRDFMRRHFRHFNAATCVAAAEAWIEHLNSGGKMMLTLGGAVSTAELGISIAELIRNDKIHAICCTGANIEEDLFNLVAHDHYVRIPNYRDMTIHDEEILLARRLNRVTDTCIPEEEAMRRIEGKLLNVWRQADTAGESRHVYEHIYTLIRSGELAADYQIDPQDSWVLAACEANLPIFVPGWEDSTLGNVFTARVLTGDLSRYCIVKPGTELMAHLIHWYLSTTVSSTVGFFQIGGGISGDFPICVVPLIQQDMSQDCELWAYFCQIGDSTTSYGSYSGANPREKITWGKLSASTPMFMIESDATIVAPLIFAFVLGEP